MKIGLISFFFFLLTLLMYGQPSVITCLNVKDNGDVEINWLPYTGENFEKYSLFHSPDNITYTEIFSTNNMGQTNYLDMGASADNASQFYKLKIYFAGDSAVSETLQTLFLFLDASQAGKAVLSWNPPNSSSVNRYRIWRKYASGNWSAVETDYSGTFYNDIIENGVCDTYIAYKVELLTSYGCFFYSNVQGNTFSETNYPDKPVFDSVSINYFNNTPHIVLGWEPSYSSDIAGYIIYRQYGSTFYEVDTVSGVNTTFFVDSLVPACDTVYTYALASIDQCGNKSPGTFAMPLSNIRLIDVQYNPCKKEAVITFDPFIDLDADSMHFDLIGNSSIGGGVVRERDIRPLDSPSEIRESTQYRMVVDTNLNYNRTYDYFIREKVYKYGRFYTTSTCVKGIFAYNYNRADHVYLANTNVLPDNRITLKVDYDTQVKDSYLEFWRSDAGQENSKYLKTIYVDTLSGWPLQWTDATADGSTGYYHYQVNVLDSCRKDWIDSDDMKTIFLTVTVKDKSHNLLQWNRFQGWDEHVGKYYIYRLEEVSSPVTLVDSVEWYADSYEYTDNISTISGEVEHLTYWVQAVERVEDSYGFREISNSNRVSVTPESDIYFPNAFKPGGSTPLFKPVFRFLGGSEYLFQIYNRWGQLIFETRDPESGWDGTFKGILVAKGTYIFKFQYMDGFGNRINKQGTVTVIY